MSWMQINYYKERGEIMFGIIGFWLLVSAICVAFLGILTHGIVTLIIKLKIEKKWAEGFVEIYMWHELYKVFIIFTLLLIFFSVALYLIHGIMLGIVSYF